MTDEFNQLNRLNWITEETHEKSDGAPHALQDTAAQSRSSKPALLWFRPHRPDDSACLAAILFLLFLLTGSIWVHAEGSAVLERLPSGGTNSFYVNERPPLAPTALLPLPSGSIQPRGWLRVFLERQRDGLTGHLGEISSWLQKGESAWLSKTGQGKYGWEELPYWLRGYLELAWIFDDPKMQAEAQSWIAGVLESQRPDGDFGPDQRFEDGSRDFWANMIMLYCLQTYHDHTGDHRVIDLMTKYFHYQNSVPDEKFLTHYWQHMRGGDNLYSVLWLYNGTGDPQLLDLAKKIHRRTADWTKKGDLPDWHNVNIAESFREPAEIALLTHDRSQTEATYADFQTIRARFGQVPGGMFGGDEVSRKGFVDPRQATETCGFVEQMLSDEILFQITGDPFWGDHCENVAFNSYPAALMPDFKALRYLTAPNMVLSDSQNHAPGIANGGPFLLMNPFSSRCCQHNHSQGWPYFSRSLWMVTADNGLCATLYSACNVAARVGKGENVIISEETHYPFEESVSFSLSTPKPATFPLSWRIPAWCRSARLSLNGNPVGIRPLAGQFARLDRTWNDGDKILLELPMVISVRTWTNNQDSVSVDYGPLTFSLKIGERYERVDSAKTAINDSSWQKGADSSNWPSYEIHPATAWNYGLILDKKNPAAGLKIERRSWPANDFPFTLDDVPLSMTAQARKIPQWTLDHYNLCAPVQLSPAFTTQAVETAELVPMGAARLRISAFPTVTTNALDGHLWQTPESPKPSKFKASASHCFESDTVEALGDGLLPNSSNDQSLPRFTWWPHVGSREWVQFDFGVPRKISAAGVYWFDDTGSGRCRVPSSARLLYKDGDEWKIVPGGGLGVKPDTMNRTTFAPITATAFRLDTQLQPQFSAGILEWEIPD
jgi:hypothetical protein